jgi:beta-galactosidase GanA
MTVSIRRRGITAGLLTAGLVALPILSELRVKPSSRPFTDAWQRTPVERRGATRLGISFRPRQVEALGLDPQATLRELLDRPFQVIRLGAYWNRIEPRAGVFDTSELDWQVDAAERAGKQIVLCVGALKTFGYPEFFVPAHQLAQPFREGRLVRPSDYPELLAAARAFSARIVERYRSRARIVAWQVEHEAVDPLGIEHSWRLQASFVEQEVAAVRAADPSRPILMNSYFPASLLVAISQWWQMRDQGSSQAVAQRLADIVGVDYYPRHALVGLGGRTLYVDGTRGIGQRRVRERLFDWARASSGRRLMVTEGQAEPWEAVTTPPNPDGRMMSSCRPQDLIEHYNRWMRWTRQAGGTLDAYLFWGAEYWVRRHLSGDSRYLQAFDRILTEA